MTPSQRIFEDGYALLIGVGYCIDERFSLPGTVNDAQGLKQVLTDSDRCGYPSDHVSLVVNNLPGIMAATKRGILNGLRWLEEHTTPASTVIIYFSGHAMRASAQKLVDAETFYLVCSDADLD